MYSTPKASNDFAMAILVLVSKKALANCSPSVRTRVELGKQQMRTARGYRPLRVLSIILKLETLLRKSEALGAYGLKRWVLLDAEPFVLLGSTATGDIVEVWREPGKKI